MKSNTSTAHVFTASCRNLNKPLRGHVLYVADLIPLQTARYFKIMISSKVTTFDSVDSSSATLKLVTQHQIVPHLLLLFASLVRINSLPPMTIQTVTWIFRWAVLKYGRMLPSPRIIITFLS